MLRAAAPASPALADMTKTQLLELAVSLGLSGLSASKKADIITAIEAVM